MRRLRLFYVSGSVSCEIKALATSHGVLTSSTSIAPGTASDNTENERTESFGNSSWNEVRNESTKDPKDVVSFVNCKP